MIAIMLVVESDAGKRLLETQMNADETRMNTDKAMQGICANFARRANTHETLFGSYLRSSAFHLRSSAFPALVLQSIDCRQVAPEAVGVHAEAEDVAVGDGD